MEDVVIPNRDEDFVHFIVDDLTRRRDDELAFYAEEEFS
jgi:hypothetical protein